MNIAAIIGICIGIVVGVNLISPVNDVVRTITTPTYEGTVVSLAGVITLLFVTVIIMGMIGWKIHHGHFESNLIELNASKRGSLNALWRMVIAVLTPRMNRDNVERLDGAHPLYCGAMV